MRVIDIDPILAWANDPEVHEPYGVRGSELMRKLWDAPTIDAVSVVHGEWIHYIDGFGLNTTKCSACGIDFNTSDGYGWNYCPYCGAKMKGEDDETD